MPFFSALAHFQRRYLRPKILSATVASSTPEEWFHRCSGDWDQVRNADKLPGDFSGRCWYGLLGNFDEACDFLLSLGLLSDPSTSSKDKAKSKVNPYQSAFNKLLQFGSSVRATKTAGSYGERPDRTISMGITCNMHRRSTFQWKGAKKVPRCHWPTGTTS